jgi:hypothetical protein
MYREIGDAQRPQRFAQHVQVIPMLLDPFVQ